MTSAPSRHRRCASSSSLWVPTCPPTYPRLLGWASAPPLADRHRKLLAGEPSAEEAMASLYRDVFALRAARRRRHG